MVRLGTEYNQYFVQVFFFQNPETRVEPGILPEIQLFFKKILTLSVGPT